VDGNGVVIDDSAKRWKGHLARETTLAPAISLAANAANGGQRQKQSADGAMLVWPMRWFQATALGTA